MKIQSEAINVVFRQNSMAAKQLKRTLDVWRDEGEPTDHDDLVRRRCDSVGLREGHAAFAHHHAR